MLIVKRKKLLNRRQRTPATEPMMKPSMKMIEVA